MNLRHRNGIMVLATVFVGHGYNSHSSPFEALFCQYGSTREAWDDVSIMEDDRVGVALLVESEGLLDLCLGGNGLLVVDHGGWPTYDDNGMVGFGTNILHLFFGGEGDGAFGIDMQECDVAHHHVDTTGTCRDATPEVLVTEIAVFHQLVSLLVHEEIGRFDVEQHFVSGAQSRNGAVADHLPNGVAVVCHLMCDRLQSHLDVGRDGSR